MAIDNKYGRVELEHGTIHPEEPVVVFRAQDKLLPVLLERYRELCLQAGSPPRHLDLIDESTAQVIEWQTKFGNRTPNSVSSTLWMDH